MSNPIDETFSVLLSMLGAGDVPLDPPISVVLARANGDPVQIAYEFFNYIFKNPGLFMIFKRFLIIMATGSLSAIRVVSNTIMVNGYGFSVGVIKVFCVLLVLLLAGVGTQQVTGKNLQLYVEKINHATAKEVAGYFAKIVDAMHQYILRAVETAKSSGTGMMIRQMIGKRFGATTKSRKARRRLKRNRW